MPILEIIIRQLGKFNFSHITITLNHMSEIIKAYFQDGDKLGIKIDYTFENKPLSTMGPLSLVDNLPDNFLVMNGDILTDLDFNSFFEYHKINNNNFTISSYQRKEMIDYGVLNKNKKNQLIRFQEKPDYDFLVSMGIYMVNKKILDYIPIDKFFGFDDLMKLLIKKKKYASIYEHKGYWLDIGRPKDYEKAIDEFIELKLL